MPASRYKHDRFRFEKRLPERNYQYEEGLIAPVEPYMHNENQIYYNSSSAGSLVMPANWITTGSSTYVNSGYVYGGGGGGSITWNPPAVAAPPMREKTPLEWLDEQVGAVCRRSGL